MKWFKSFPKVCKEIWLRNCADIFENTEKCENLVILGFKNLGYKNFKQKWLLKNYVSSLG